MSRDALGQVRGDGPVSVAQACSKLRAAGFDIETDMRLRLHVAEVASSLARADRGETDWVGDDTTPTGERTVDRPTGRGRPGIRPSLASALRRLVDYAGPTNAALALLVCRLENSDSFPVVVGDLRLRGSAGTPDGRRLVQRLKQRVSAIATSRRA